MLCNAKQKRRGSWDEGEGADPRQINEEEDRAGERREKRDEEGWHSPITSFFSLRPRTCAHIHIGPPSVCVCVCVTRPFATYKCGRKLGEFVRWILLSASHSSALPAPISSSIPLLVSHGWKVYLEGPTDSGIAVESCKICVTES